MLFEKLFGKINEVEDTHGEDDTPMLNLTYTKIPRTLDLVKRENEEKIRAKYNLPKKKTGELL